MAFVCPINLSFVKVEIIIFKFKNDKIRINKVYFLSIMRIKTTNKGTAGIKYLDQKGIMVLTMRIIKVNIVKYNQVSFFFFMAKKNITIVATTPKGKIKDQSPKLVTLAPSQNPR